MSFKKGNPEYNYKINVILSCLVSIIKYTYNVKEKIIFNCIPKPTY